MQWTPGSAHPEAQCGLGGQASLEGAEMAKALRRECLGHPHRIGWTALRGVEELLESPQATMRACFLGAAQKLGM